MSIPGDYIILPESRLVTKEDLVSAIPPISDVADQQQSPVQQVPDRVDAADLVEASIPHTYADHVNHPPHYCADRYYEPIDVIEDWGLGFHLGNAVKYISRAGRKDDELTDLKKALWYVQRRIKQLEGE